MDRYQSNTSDAHSRIVNIKWGDDTFGDEGATKLIRKLAEVGLCLRPAGNTLKELALETEDLSGRLEEIGLPEFKALFAEAAKHIRDAGI